MHLIVGLGNPGGAYQGTRHNIGFHMIDGLADQHRITFAASKWQAKIAKANMWGQSVILVKPQTYMNDSGRAVGQIAAYYNVQPLDIIVLHDDLDLALARIKVAYDRGAGGHNGILSLISHLQGRQFVRVRIGVGRPEPSTPVKDYVLGRFLPAEETAVSQQMSCIHQAIQVILEKGHLSAMAIVNSRKID